MTRVEYETLCEEIWKHNKLYYEGSPIISDEKFDHLLKKLEQIEKEHPDWVTPSSPTQRVGETPSKGFETVLHRIPMLSLANTYSKDELADFVKRMHKLLEKQEVLFSCELKMDGVAITAHYEKGRFTEGVTRGDGKRGDDITANMRTIRSLPLHLYGKHVPEKLEIRGEVFMPHAVFEKHNKERATAESALWANPRNAAAGSLKLLDPRIVAKRGLQVVFYGLAEDSSHSVTSQYETHAFLKSLGLPTLHHLAKCHNLDEIWAFAEKVRKDRPHMPFDIDGVVVKLDDLRDQQRLGNTAKNPRWAVAYKFAAEQATTRIKEITVQVGRTGVLTPVAELEPIYVAGSTIARATLHNEDEVKRKDIRVGDFVTIEKGGDVIPKVVEVLHDKRGSHSHPWKMPEHCPACGTLVVREAKGVAVRCPNRKGCPEQSVRRIQFFASKPAMDIDGMGVRVVEQLVDKGFVSRPSDIYQLTAKEIGQLEGFKDKAIHNLLTSIDQSKSVPLERFIMALGIQHIGARTAEDLAQRTGSIQALQKMSKEELLEIEGIGDIVADSLVGFFADPEHQDEVQRLLDSGVHPKKIEVTSSKGHPFHGKTFVLTGTLQKYTRSEAAAQIKKKGGKLSDSVTKTTDFIVAGDSPGSKLDKARSLGITILSEDDFEKNLQV